MASRPWNYGSGPAMLPEEVLHEAQGALVNLNGSGLSVLEISHRSPTFQRVIDEADANLRSLLYGALDDDAGAPLALTLDAGRFQTRIR